MLRLLHALLLGLFGAGIVHIIVLLLVPAYSERDAWTQLAASTGLYQPARLSAEPGVKSVDPLFNATACRFDLSDGILHVNAKGQTPFWSVSVYNRAGENMYSFNDHTLPDGKVDFIVLTPAQMVELRKEIPEGVENMISVESSAKQGIVVVRSFVPDDSWKKSVSDFLDSITCKPQ
jgi:uncharacterized membrane protein